MGKFLADNWIWIVAPIVIVMVAMVAVLLLTRGNDPGSFVYPIF